MRLANQTTTGCNNTLYLLVLLFCYVGFNNCEAKSMSDSSVSIYTQLCDDIVNHAKDAARLHNAGQVPEAMKHVEAARSSFNEAVKIDDQEPQAYFNMANFLLNTQNLEESIPLWEAAAQRVGDVATKNFLLEKKKWATFGLHSSRRDQSYNDGNGNLTAAMQHAKEQLKIYQSPEVFFDMATMQTMITSVGLLDPSLPMNNFRAAQQTAYDAWVLGLSKRHPRYPLDTSRSIKCASLKDTVSKLNTHDMSNDHNANDATREPLSILRNWRDVADGSEFIQFPESIQPIDDAGDGGEDNLCQYSVVLIEAVAMKADTYSCAFGGRRYTFAQTKNPLYIAKISEVYIWGGDGIISHLGFPIKQEAQDNNYSGNEMTQCVIFLASGDSYINLPQNLQLQQNIWGMQPPGSWHDYSKGITNYFGQWPFHQLSPETGNPAASVLPHIHKAASVVQYAVMSYYHWVLEALGRLILILDAGLLATNEDGEGMVLVLPLDKSTNGFVTQYLNILQRIYPNLRSALNRTNTGVMLQDCLMACYKAAGKSEKVSKVTSLLEKYSGNEETLALKLSKKYKTVPQCRIPQNALKNMVTHKNRNDGRPSVFWYDSGLYPNDARLVIDDLYFANWDKVSLLAQNSQQQHAQDGVDSIIFELDEVATNSLHALTPGLGINLIQTRLLEAMRLSFPESQLPNFQNSRQGELYSRGYILYLSRASESMRRLKNRQKLLDMLVKAVGGDEHKVIVFDGGTTTVEETASLFHFATVVVGVHGGALSNIVFCRSPKIAVDVNNKVINQKHTDIVVEKNLGNSVESKLSGHTQLILEFGFPSTQTRHYAHAAASLNLNYQTILLAQDERGPGAAEVILDEDALTAAESLVREYFL